MEILLLGIYSFFVWLIFIKLKWLPWNIGTQVTVVIIPVVGLGATILLLNIYAPSSSDVRVYKYTVPIVSQVRGRVVDVPVEEGNRLVKKGEVLFKVDPTPYDLDVKVLEAQLANTQAGQRELKESARGAAAKTAETRGAIAQAASRTREIDAKLALARKRAQQYRELVKSGAGNRFDLERAETDVSELEGQLAAARSAEIQARASEGQAVSGERQIEQKLGANVKGEFAQVAQIRAQLENAKWLLDQTTTLSPCNCYVINLQLRPGGFVAGLPVNPVMTLVEADGQVVAFYNQNELHAVKPGDEVEFALKTMPGKIIKGKVDSIVWAIGQGQLQPSGTLPMTTVMAMPPGRYAVKFNIAERDKQLFLAAGAAGDAAIYTDSFAAIHIIRKVILRVGSYLNYLIPKLH
ncbi:MAG TPA: HlyD family secretion protein [Burkholderiales bacterium]|jgi:multidrug resistance efflux pump|nr:HlyD family secretion protein [Burkholderiales bacterium]